MFNMAQKEKITNKVLSIVKPIWDSIKMPAIIFMLFYLAGAGFFHGVISANYSHILGDGKIIVIQSIDMSEDKKR